MGAIVDSIFYLVKKIVIIIPTLNCHVLLSGKGIEIMKLSRKIIFAVCLATIISCSTCQQQPKTLDRQTRNNITMFADCNDGYIEYRDLKKSKRYAYYCPVKERFFAGELVVDEDRKMYVNVKYVGDAKKLFDDLKQQFVKN